MTHPPALDPATRIDLHLHSRASTDTGSWFLSRALLPESHTEPQTAYATAKARGMDMLTLTDHNTISGALEIAHHPDVIIGVEITARFPEDRAPVHVLAWGVDERSWADLDRARGDLYELCDVLAAWNLPHALAHPLHRVGGELTVSHLERLLLLFPIWEGLNGARPAATNHVAARIARAAGPDLLMRLAETHGIAPRATRAHALTGGSDDHSSFDVATAWTATPPAATTDELLDHLREGRVRPVGAHGDATTLAHSVGALAARAWLSKASVAIPSPLSGVVRDLLGEAPRRRAAAQTGPASVANEVLARVRADRGLVRRYRRLSRGADGSALHRARLRLATGWLHDEMLSRAFSRRRGDGVGRRAEALAAAAAVAAPYLIAAGYARGESRFAAAMERGFFGPAIDAPPPARVAMATDTFREVNGVAGTMRRLARWASDHPGCGVQVVTCGAGGPDTAAHVDLPAVTDVPLPVYGDGGWRLGVPSIVDMLDAVEASGVQVVHAATPGPVGLTALLVARTLGLPFVATYHTEFAGYVLELTGDRLAAGVAGAATGWFYRQAERVYAPTRSTARSLAEAGIDPRRIVRFGRGTDLGWFSPERASSRTRRRLGGGDTLVLYVGRISREKGVMLLADAFRRACAGRPGLRLAVVGEGPARNEMARALAGTPHRFAGTLRGDELAAAYASADLLCLPSATETFGQVVVEAAASGLPSVVVDRGGAQDQVEDGRSGRVVPASAPDALAAALALLHDDADLRLRLGAGARAAALARPGWDEVFADLVAGYRDLGGAERDAATTRVETEGAPA